MLYQIERSRAKRPAFYFAPHPPKLQPYDYQLAGVEYCVNRQNALFGDPPGLGKTIECVLLSNAIESKSNLVVCPASLRLNWEREIWKWSMLPNVSTYPVLKARDGVNLKSDYLIISYDLLRNPGIFAALMSKNWDHLILDEAHYLKDPSGNRRTQLICAPNGLKSKAGRITMASGTILPNQPIECYNAIRLLDWGAIDNISLHEFRETYYDEGGGFIHGRGGVKWSSHVLNRPKNLDDLQNRLRSKIMVRRAKEDVLEDLPPKQWHLFPLENSGAVKTALAHPGWAKADKLYKMDPGSFTAASALDGAIATARRVLGEAKAPLVAGYIKELLSEGVEKIICGAWHISVLAILKDSLKALGLVYVYMDGSTTPRARQLAVDEFNGNPEIRVILGQMIPLGEGWNLTSASDVVFAEPDWTPGRNEQLIDRAHRIGQKNFVVGHVPVVDGSLDADILGRAISKDYAIHCALDRIF